MTAVIFTELDICFDEQLEKFRGNLLNGDHLIYTDDLLFEDGDSNEPY